MGATILAALNAALGAIAGASKALASFFGWKSQQDLLNAGKASANADALKAQVQADAKAETAREAVRSASLRNAHDSLPDEFQRD
jgi:hypothetical protein